MIDVWERNYQPVTFYYRSFETIYLYLKTMPKEMKRPMLLKRVRENLEKSPSFEQLLQESEYEQMMLRKIERMVE